MRICLVANEILGAHKNGGIGTATSNLALFLARRDHNVRLVYTGHGDIDFGDRWIVALLAAGVQIVRLSPEVSPLRPTYLKESSVLFEYLRYADRELIIFQDWKGAAFGCISARSAGLAFSTCRLIVIAHGPTKWLIDANRTIVRNAETLANLRMEQIVFEGADEIICPSRYMRDWLIDSGQSSEVMTAMPLYLWADEEESNRANALVAVDTIAFFGRLEERKGIELFLRALANDVLSNRKFKILFLGKEATWSIGQIKEFIGTKCPGLLNQVEFEPHLDSSSAQDFLIYNNCLAIIPSLVDNAPCVISECIRRQIPFLTTGTGGIPELIASEDHERVLVDLSPQAMANRISDALGKSFDPVRSAYSKHDVDMRWSEWINAQSKRLENVQRSSASLQAERALNARKADRPTIAIILTHYERPALLNECLASLTIQSDSSFEVVLVDDCSASQAALQNLQQIKETDWPFHLRVLRLEQNSYLGAARNAGLRATDAELVIFLDDDNLAHPNMVETLSNAHVLTQADIVNCEMIVFRDANGAPNLNSSDELERWGFIGGPSELGLSFNCFGDATAIYKKEIFQQIGFFHELHGVGHEDWHLHVRAALAGLRFASIPVPLYWYRRLNDGMLVSTDSYINNRIIWDLYYNELPGSLRRFADLSLRNAYADRGM